MQFGSWQRRTAGKGKVCRQFLGVQKATFGTLGCRLRARSVLHCHGVLVLWHRPWTRAVPDESHLQDAASNLEAGSAERQVRARFAASFSALRKQRLALWAAGRGPDPSFTAMVF